MILKVLFIIHSAYAWSFNDLIETQTQTPLNTSFDGGNLLEKTLQQVQFVVEKDEGRTGNEYFIKFNPRGGKELVAQYRLGKVSKDLISQENNLLLHQKKMSAIKTGIDIEYSKKIQDLTTQTTKLLSHQKKAYEKALSTSNSASVKDYIKSSLTLKLFSSRLAELHSQNIALNTRIRSINPDWNLDNYQTSLNTILKRDKIVHHVKSYKSETLNFHTQLNSLRIAQAEALKDITLSQNDKLVDSVSLGIDETKKDTSISFRVSMNLPFLSSNPVQDWQSYNKIISLRRDADTANKEMKIQLEALKAYIVQISNDLDIDMSSKLDSRIEKSIFRLQSSEPLSTIALYIEYISAKITLLETERKFFLSYIDWLELSQDYSSSALSDYVGLL